MIRYALVAVNRYDGKSHTVRVFSDSTDANKRAGQLDRITPSYRHAVIPYEEEEK